MTDSTAILLVEDNAMNRDMLVRRLRRAGFSVITAENGQQALDKMRKSMPAIVLMDMNLPVVDGWTASKRARKDDSIAHIPIIALTAHAMDSDKANALRAGCDDYATKPIDFPDLLEKIRKLSTP